MRQFDKFMKDRIWLAYVAFIVDTPWVYYDPSISSYRFDLQGNPVLKKNLIWLDGKQLVGTYQNARND
jgi:hypothetical protein